MSATMRDAVVGVRPNVSEYFDRRLELMSEGCAVWFAAVGHRHEILGWVILSWSADGTDAHVVDLFVREDHRRRGIGTALMIEVERRARSGREQKLWLAVNPTANTDAMRLYEHLGFCHDGGPTYLDGVYDGFEDWVIDMRKALE